MYPIKCIIFPFLKCVDFIVLFFIETLLLLRKLVSFCTLDFKGAIIMYTPYICQIVWHNFTWICKRLYHIGLNFHSPLSSYWTPTEVSLPKCTTYTWTIMCIIINLCFGFNLLKIMYKWQFNPPCSHKDCRLTLWKIK
jgi:hypothetical protein